VTSPASAAAAADDGMPPHVGASPFAGAISAPVQQHVTTDSSCDGGGSGSIGCKAVSAATITTKRTPDSPHHATDSKEQQLGALQGLSDVPEAVIGRSPLSAAADTVQSSPVRGIGVGSASSRAKPSPRRTPGAAVAGAPEPKLSELLDPGCVGCQQSRRVLARAGRRVHELMADNTRCAWVPYAYFSLGFLMLVV
jgi:hypothetical protein